LVVRLFTARPPDAYGLAPVELPVGVKRHNVGSGNRLRRVNSTQSGPPVTPAGYTPAQVPFEQRAAFGRWHRWLTGDFKLPRLPRSMRQACLSWKLLVSVKPAGFPQTGTLSVICCVPARVFGSQVQCAVAAFGTVEPSAHPAG
jgi:hypothetical protein